MQPGDLVKLHGHPDPQLRDGRGLPLYHVGKAVVIGRPTGQ